MVMKNLINHEYKNVVFSKIQRKHKSSLYLSNENIT